MSLGKDLFEKEVLDMVSDLQAQIEAQAVKVQAVKAEPATPKPKPTPKFMELDLEKRSLMNLATSAEFRLKPRGPAASLSFRRVQHGWWHVARPY